MFYYTIVHYYCVFPMKYRARFHLRYVHTYIFYRESEITLLVTLTFRRERIMEV